MGKKKQPIEEVYVSHVTATLAKDKGFNEYTERFFNSFYPSGQSNINGLTNYDKVTGKRDSFTSLPTQSLLQKWLREECNIHILVSKNTEFDYRNTGYGDRDFGYYIQQPYDFAESDDEEDYKTYEEALEAALVFALNKI